MTILQVVYQEADNALHYHFTTDMPDQPFTLTGVVNPSYRDYLLCYDGHHLRLYVNGALYDEEWPYGEVTGGGWVLDADPNHVERAVFYDQAPDDDAITQIYGADVRQQAHSDLVGNVPSGMQYFRPSGFNAFAGDCMPFYDHTTGIFHLYYLFDRRQHHSKHGFGAHQWAHASTPDLMHWEHHPIALGITDESEGSICTGSVIYKDGLYYAFYAKRDIADRCEKIMCATGSTPNHFEKTNKVLYTFPAPPYVPGPGRDPCVFQGEDGKYYMLVTTRIQDSFNGNRGGCLARLVSDDLQSWDLLPPFLPGYADDPECSDYFKMNDWYYLIFSNEGVAKYRMSRHPFGPWQRPAHDTFDAPCCRVMKSAAFAGGRRITATFLEKKLRSFAGNIVFRELKQRPDGTLYASPVPELEPKPLRSIMPEMTVSDHEKATLQPEGIFVQSRSGFASVKAEALPRNYRLTVRVKPSAGSAYTGISFRNKAVYADGYEIKFNLLQSLAEIRKASEGYLFDNNMHTITDLGDLCEGFDLTLIVHDDIADVCVNGQSCLCARVSPPAEDGKLFLYAHDAEVRFENLCIEEI